MRARPTRRNPSSCPIPEAASIRQQVVEVGTDLRRIRIPGLLPVTVDLPLRAAQLVVVDFAPLLNGSVRRAQPAIRAEMRRPGGRPGWKFGKNDLALLDKRPKDLNTHLE